MIVSSPRDRRAASLRLTARLRASGDYPEPLAIGQRGQRCHPARRGPRSALWSGSPLAAAPIGVDSPSPCWINRVTVHEVSDTSDRDDGRGRDNWRPNRSSGCS